MFRISLSLLRFIRRKFLLPAAVVALFCCALFTAAWFLFPFPDKHVSQFPVSLMLTDSDGQPLRVVLGNNDALCRPVPLADSGAWTAKALIAAEDKRFYSHPGIDLIAALRALWFNLSLARITSGASTISTQLIRITNPRDRTVKTKCIEAFRALQLESRFSKDQILELYLNHAPFGANLTGIEAASRYYFGTSAGELTMGEATLLVGMLQAPTRFRPDIHPDAAFKRRNYVIERMASLGFLSPAESRTARSQPVSVVKKSNPFSAPHFCDLVLQSREYLCSSLADSNGSVRTTLDPTVQSIVESAAARHSRRLQSAGVFGTAVVVLEVSSGNVLAMIGSPDYFDNDHAGQVNVCQAPRSPGSTLKPFVYALAFDRGILTPDSILGDVPVQFPDYAPRNADLSYSGLVSARDALINSLNIPALSLTQRVGLDEFVDLLHSLGLNSIDKPPGHYGLSLVLGTAEVSLLNVVNAYACLARRGIWSPYHLLAAESPGQRQSVFSPEAAWLVSDILSGDERAIAASGHAADAVLPRVAWKTGTSNGKRDAWTVAYNPQYVVGVWTGNPDGNPSDILTGLDAAAPIAHDILRNLYPGGDAPWFCKPEGIATRSICSRSGQPAGPWCKECVDAVCIAGVSNPKPCLVHQPRPVNHASGSVPADLSNKSNTSSLEITETWPPDIAAYLARAGNQSYSPDSAAVPASQESRLRILSPRHGSTYHLMQSASTSIQELRLSASGSADILYWFVDNTYIGLCPSSSGFGWELRKGRHLIACTDTRGLSASAVISVN